MEDRFEVRARFLEGIPFWWNNTSALLPALPVSVRFALSLFLVGGFLS